MQAINGVDLNEVVEKTNLELLEEDRRKVSEEIKKIIYRIAGLKIELRDCDKKRASILEKLDKAEAKMLRVKQGDWSVLSEPTDTKE